MKKIAGIRGMNDISPEETPYWQLIESAARDVLNRYGYREVRPPIVERTELFRRGVGEATDIVEKEMYTFTDRGGDSLSLRPECTASCVRAAVQHNWLAQGGQRIWHTGPMFRYERPQKGRYRQFHQLDVEALGFAGPDVDSELIALSSRLWQKLGLRGVRLEINSLGERSCQAAYRETLVEYFSDHTDALDEDSTRRLGTNPLRILDSKNPALQHIIEAAPRLLDQLDEASAEHFDKLQAMLREAGIAFTVNARLVRGLDYYTKTVFEWVTDDLGAQNAICGGGRYDGLIAEVGGTSRPAIGFAAGMERLVALLQDQGAEPAQTGPNAYLLAVGETAERAALGLAEHLRGELPTLRLVVDAASGSFRSKMKRADRSTADFALILGEEEAACGKVGFKTLRGEAQQATVSAEEVINRLGAALDSPGV